VIANEKQGVVYISARLLFTKTSESTCTNVICYVPAG